MRMATTDGKPIALTVQGNAVSVGSGTIAAIDTGTTNIAGPTDAIKAIYAQIPNSSPATGQWAGYYQYRTSVSAAAAPRSHLLHFRFSYL